MTTDPGLRRLALRTLLAAFPGTTPPEWLESLLAEGLAGVTLFAFNVGDQPDRLTAGLRAARPDLVIAIDEEGGDVTRLRHTTGSPYPGNAALGVVDDPSVTGGIYRSLGTELAAAGITLNLAPTVDVNTAEDNPIIGTRSFGADPLLVAAHAAAAVTGLQSAGVAACAKHFPGHGATTSDSHLTLPTIVSTVPALHARDLPPFAAAVDAGAQAIMTAHVRVPALTGPDPATFSPAALRLLREELGFTGAVVSDALEMAGAAAPAGGIPAAAVRALAAGVDLLCVGAAVNAALIESIVDAVVSADLPPSRLEEAASRVAALAAWTGPATEPPPPDGLGYQAARRAIRVEGSLDSWTDPLLIQLDSAGNIAEGRVPWGLAPLVQAVVTLRPADTSVDQLRRLAGARPLVVIARHAHRSALTRSLVEEVAKAHPTAVVEMGWPSRHWRPAGARAFITTHGASRASGSALADLLALG